jgi:acyl-CoA dehydrogenase family protein 9
MSQSKKISPELSVAKSLFLGTVVEQNIFPFPTFSPEEKETLSMVIESVQRFMEGKHEDFRAYDVKGEQPKEYIESLQELGLFGLIIGEAYNGIGLSNAGYSRVLQETSRFDASTSLTIGAHSSIGMKGLLLFGNDEQKKRYLPKLASGEMIAAFCLTEPGSGSDAASIKTTAVKNSDGSWMLNGDKLWITNGPIASFFTVFARTDTDKGKMSAFIVERDFVGVTNGPKEDKMGIRGSATSTVTFQNTIVPAVNLLGEEGQGFKIAMAILNNGRTGLGGGCVGAMKQCIALASKQARERKQFGTPIGEFGLIQEKLAQMSVQCYAAESVVSMVAHLIDSGVEDYSVEAAISKIFATEALWNVVFEALQIAGGNGFMREYPYERVTRDSRINLIFEGTNEILRLYIALSGLKDVAEYLKEVQSSASKIFTDPIKGFGVLSKYTAKKVTSLSPFSGDTLSQVHPQLKESAEILATYTKRLSQASDALVLKYRKKIIDEQLQTKRVADIAIDLFVGLSMLSRVSASLASQASQQSKDDEVKMLTLFVTQAKRRMHSSLQRLITNEDDLVKELGAATLAEGFRWDTL